MSWIYRLSMKTKLAIALLPLLIALLWLAGAGMLSRIDTERQMRNVEEVTRLAKSAGDVVHELQKERGLSAGYLGSRGAQFNRELTAQRARTDSALATFNAAMKNTDEESLKGSVGEAIRAFRQRVSMLDDTRQQITALSVPAPQGVAFYTDTISTVLELVGRSTRLSHAGVIVNQMVVYYSLLSMKEQAGVERALLSGIFFADRFADGQLARLSEVVGKQQAWLAASRQLSDAEGVKRIDAALGTAVSDPRAGAASDSVRESCERWVWRVTGELVYRTDAAYRYPAHAGERRFRAASRHSRPACKRRPRRLAALSRHHSAGAYRGGEFRRRGGAQHPSSAACDAHRH